MMVYCDTANSNHTANSALNKFAACSTSCETSCFTLTSAPGDLRISTSALAILLVRPGGDFFCSIFNSHKSDHSLSFSVLKWAGYLLKRVSSLCVTTRSDGLTAKHSDLEDQSLVILQLLSSSVATNTFEMIRIPQVKLRTIVCVVFWRTLCR